MCAHFRSTYFLSFENLFKNCLIVKIYFSLRFSEVRSDFCHKQNFQLFLNVIVFRVKNKKKAMKGFHTITNLTQMIYDLLNKFFWIKRSDLYGSYVILSLIKYKNTLKFSFVSTLTMMAFSFELFYLFFNGSVVPV